MRESCTYGSVRGALSNERPYRNGPSGLASQGWLPNTLTPGMPVKVWIHPLRDGQVGGQFLAVTLPDGKQMGNPAGRGNN